MRVRVRRIAGSFPAGPFDGEQVAVGDPGGFLDFQACVVFLSAGPLGQVGIRNQGSYRDPGRVGHGRLLSARRLQDGSGVGDGRLRRGDGQGQRTSHQRRSHTPIRVNRGPRATGRYRNGLEPGATQRRRGRPGIWG